MANKPKDTYYSEFRNFTEYVRRGNFRIKRELLPPISAWLLMIGRRYEKAVVGLDNPIVLNTVPGAREALKSNKDAVTLIQNLLNILPVNFHVSDWQPAVTALCTLMGIAEGAGPAGEIPDDQFTALLGVTDDGRDEVRSGENVHVSVGTRQERGDERPGDKPSRSRRNRKDRVAKKP